MPPTDKDRTNRDYNDPSYDKNRDENTRDLPKKDAEYDAYEARDESVKGGMRKNVRP